MVNLQMTTLDDIVPEVQAECVGCPPPVIRSYLSKAWQEFARRTTVWRHEVATITVETDRHTYPMDWPGSAQPMVVTEARYRADSTAFARTLYPMPDVNAKGPIQAGRYDQTFDYHYRGSNWRDWTGTPRWYMHDFSTYQIRFIPVPTSDDNGALIDVILAVAPRRDEIDIPEWILERYYESLAAGAKARLFKIPDAPWTNIEKAALEHDIWERKVALAASNQARSHTHASLRVEPMHSLA